MGPALRGWAPPRGVVGVDVVPAKASAGSAGARVLPILPPAFVVGPSSCPFPSPRSGSLSLPRLFCVFTAFLFVQVSVQISVPCFSTTCRGPCVSPLSFTRVHTREPTHKGPFLVRTSGLGVPTRYHTRLNCTQNRSASPGERGESLSLVLASLPATLPGLRVHPSAPQFPKACPLETVRGQDPLRRRAATPSLPCSALKGPCPSRPGVAPPGTPGSLALPSETQEAPSPLGERAGRLSEHGPPTSPPPGGGESPGGP